MNSRDNLRKAAKDLFGVEIGRPEDELSMGGNGQPASVEDIISGHTRSIEGPQMPEVTVLEPRKHTSVIAEGTSIVGRILSDGHVEIMGKVDGNINAEGDVTVCGKVTGDIEGDHLKMFSCQVKGNLTAENRVIVNDESTIIGDIATDSIIFDGKLKGNISANQTAVFNSNSYLLGDITTSTLSIDAGAVINGMVKTYIDYDANSPFEDM